MRRAVTGLIALVIAAAATLPGAVAAPPAGVGEWESRAPSLVNREEGSFVEVGGKFYLGWGRYQTTQEVYDPATDTWSVAGGLPADLNHLQGVVVNGLVYFIGGFGFDPRHEVGTVYVFDPATNAWSTRTSMPAGRNRGAGGVALWNGTIYYLGGMHDHLPVSWVDAYDIATDTWTTLPDMPHARDHLEAAAVNGRVYAIGGRLGDPTKPVAATDRYDIAQGTWATGLAPLPHPRAGSGIVQMGGELWILGGWNGAAPLHDVDAYDVASDTWRALSPMPTARDGVQALVWQGNVYVAGGGTLPKGTGPTNVLEVYIPGSTVRPDALIKPATGGAALGDDVYNLTGLGQSTSIATARKASRVFTIQVSNDGSTPEAFSVRGSAAASSAFTVAYLQGASGTTDVTAAVLAGSYTTAVLAPGAVATLRLRVTVRAGALLKAAQAAVVTVASTSRPTSRDVVVATVTVKK